jgi:hypothetical protein
MAINADLLPQAIVTETIASIGFQKAVDLLWIRHTILIPWLVVHSRMSQYFSALYGQRNSKRE